MYLGSNERVETVGALTNLGSRVDGDSNGQGNDMGSALKNVGAYSRATYPGTTMSSAFLVVPRIRLPLPEH